MSVELYLQLAKWLLAWETCDGVFAFCLLVLTWNLACRVKNTAKVQMSQVAWSTCFDSFTINFAHTKSDQEGDEAKHCRCWEKSVRNN